MTNNWLFSYPKSGANLIRYCIEFLSESPTKGQSRLVKSANKNKYVLLRSHHGKTLNKNNNLILLLRNYRELALRPWLGWEDVAPIEKVKYILKRYRGILSAYDIHKGKKTIIYYEDIIQSFSSLEPALCNILDIKLKKDFKELVNNETFHRQKSLKLGNKDVFSDSKTPEFYQHDINKDILMKMDNIAEDILGEFYSYVEIYKINKNDNSGNWT
jgi:hypothetical protein